jgi:hypothetical protein
MHFARVPGVNLNVGPLDVFHGPRHTLVYKLCTVFYFGDLWLRWTA